MAGAAPCASSPGSTRCCSGGATAEGARILSPQAVEAITARHRVGLYDETFHAQCDWGLGVAVDAYAFGRHASPRAFGHGGALSSVSVADPEHGLVACVQTNGMCGNDDHYLRLSEILTARTSISASPRSTPPGRASPFRPSSSTCRWSRAEPGS